MEVVRQSHTVPKIGTVCNDFHFAYCVNHTRLALANRRPQNSLWDGKPSPPNSKKKKRKPSLSPRHKNPHPAHHPLRYVPHSHLHKLLRVYAMAPPIAAVNTLLDACRRQAAGKAHRITPLPLAAAYRHRLSRRCSRLTQLRSVGESAVLRVLSNGRQGN